MSVSDALNDNADLMSRLANITTEEQNVTENLTKERSLESVKQLSRADVCVCVRTRAYMHM